MPSVITPCGGAGGWNFVTYPQTGAWGYLEFTGSGGPNGWAFEASDPNSNGMVWNTGFFRAGDVDQVNNGARFTIKGTGIDNEIKGSQRFTVMSTTAVFIHCKQAVAPQIGFFGATPANRPATPVTLGDVIAALQTLGLVA
jgi:hypothetical protein